MIQIIRSIFAIPELRKRILFTFALLVVYRIGAHIPTPGIDLAALDAFFEASKGTLLGFFDMFSGGALRRLTIFALGIMPYIDAAIILELLKVVIPHLARLAKEGEAGRKKLTQYTRYGTIVIGVVQALGISIGLESMSAPDGAAIVPSPGLAFRLLTIITLTSGTAFIMWLGEQITERGIGNGISLIIMAGIVVRLPMAIANTFYALQLGQRLAADDHLSRRDDGQRSWRSSSSRRAGSARSRCSTRGGWSGARCSAGRAPTSR